MRIWVDLANAPHVNFFAPIIGWFRSHGHDVGITFRDFNQTVELAAKNGIEGSLIGTHGGAQILGKFRDLVERSTRMSLFALGKGFALAANHTSFAQSIACWELNIRLIQIMDYEGQPGNHLSFRLANKVIVPKSFPDSALKRFGAPPGKVFKYEGFKEQVYLSDFKPDASFPEKLQKTCGFSEKKDFEGRALVTVRTPASMALYHRFKNPLFLLLLDRLHRMTDVIAVVLPRTNEQRRDLRSRYPNFIIPAEPLDGLNLLYYSDVAISAGGTMNREAAVLGVPAFTIFAGEIPAIDSHLIDLGRLGAINNESDIDKLVFSRNKCRAMLRNPTLCEEIAQEILSSNKAGRLSRFFL